MPIFEAENAKTLAKHHRQRVAVLDVGARDGLQWPWSDVSPTLLTPVLVEPDPKEAALLQKKLDRSSSGQVLPVALWHEEGQISVSLNRSPGTSSVFKPNKPLLQQFPEADRFDTTRSVTVEARTIESLSANGEIPRIDFAKLDIQGAELAVLKGGQRYFSENLIGLEAEVEFAELYSGQPLFCDIDAFVQKELGLELWDIRGTYWRYAKGNGMGGPTKGRMVFGDALYFRPLPALVEWLAGMSAETAAHKTVALVVSTLAYGYPDYASAVLDEPAIRKLLIPEVIESLDKALAATASGLRPFANGNGYLYLIFGALSRMFKPSHNGWATGSENLGSRRRGPAWW